MKKVVVTGATGFVGSNLTRRLLGDGHQVHLLVRPEHDAWRIADLLGDVRLLRADLRDRDALNRTIDSIRPEWIFHLAAYGAYPTQIDLDMMIEINLRGTVNLIESCHRNGFEAFINTGSSSEYGFKNYPPTEMEMLEPNSNYAITKASATLFCRSLAVTKNLNLTTLRLYSVYGPHEEPSRLIPKLIVHGLDGDLPPLVRPSIARDFVYVDDVVEAYIHAASHPGLEPGTIYNVGTGQETRLLEAVRLARELLPVKQEPQWATMPDRSWDTETWCANSEKIRRELGWSPRYDFIKGFSATINWFLNNPDQLRFYRTKMGLSE